MKPLGISSLFVHALLHCSFAILVISIPYCAAAGYHTELVLLAVLCSVVLCFPVADPLRHFVDGLLSLPNPIGSVGDKVNVGIFRCALCWCTLCASTRCTLTAVCALHCIPMPDQAHAGLAEERRRRADIVSVAWRSLQHAPPVPALLRCAHCAALRCTALWQCCAPQFSAAWHSVWEICASAVQRSAALKGTMQSSAALRSAARRRPALTRLCLTLCHVALRCAAPRSATLCCPALPFAAPCCAAPCRTAHCTQHHAALHRVTAQRHAVTCVLQHNDHTAPCHACSA